ncbi:MAG: ImcF-related family protein [Terriglobales bacterium]
MASPKSILSYGAAIVVALLIAWFAGAISKLTGGGLWMLRIGVALAGALVIAAVWWILQRSKKGRDAADASAAGPDDVDRLVREAAAKIAASRLGRGCTLSSLPAFFVLGESGAGKTSDVVFSGLDPELLAGHVYQDGGIVPTPVANIWFARKTLFIEAAGKLAAESRPWVQLSQRLSPGQLWAVFSSRKRAARAALVCFDCRKLAGAKNLDSISSSAAALRARLEEMSQQLGASFPVYVFFNRLDSLPHFEEFAAALSNEEAAEAIGVTLPPAPASQSGVYAEQESRRLAEAFNRVCSSLADWRPGLLSREHDGAKLPAIYEFPREFGKLSRPVTHFLVDLCRPSHLRAGPFLRGFYFTGMRMVSPAGSVSGTIIAAKTMLQPKPAVSTSATTILRPDELAAATMSGWAGATLTPGTAEIRLVPQWLFLGHVFTEVLLRDAAALGASAASTKVSFWRRALLATAAIVGLVFIAGFLVSFFGNNAREARVEAAARAIRFNPVPASQLASQSQLAHLDALRQSLAPLIRYKRSEPPLHLRWGLYDGDRVREAGLAVYFRRFHQLLLASTQEAMRRSLAQFPLVPAPGEAYSPAYATLKAYLVTTADPDKATCSFLTPALMKDWDAGRTASAEQSELAARQFGFYCQQLRNGTPYSSKYDDVAVMTAREYLAGFGATQRIYNAMIASASKASPEFDFRQSFPRAEALVHDSAVVPGAFTKAGWKFIQGAIAHSDRYFSGEKWVLGAQAAQSIDRAKLREELLDRYQTDYVQHWREFLNRAAVTRYASIDDAANKLLALSGNRSPLLLLLCQVSMNTAVGSKEVETAFQSVQQVVPPACKNQFVQAANTAYINALLQLQGCMSQVSTATPAQRDSARSACLSQADDAQIAALQMAQKFRIDQQGGTERTVQHLMAEPIQAAQVLLKPAGPGNARDVCAQYDALRSAYPFNASGQRLARLDEVNAFFAPATGAVSRLYRSQLTNVLIPEGPRFIPNPSGQFQLNPQFLRFFNRAMAIQQALYPNGAKQPQYAFTLIPLPNQGIQTLNLTIDGRSYTSNGKNRHPMPFYWPGTGAQGVTLTAKLSGGSRLTLLNFSGLWAAFRFFSAASTIQPSGATWTVQWSPTTSGQPMTLRNGHPVTIRFQAETKGASFIFQPGFFSRLSCRSRILR